MADKDIYRPPDREDPGHETLRGRRRALRIAQYGFDSGNQIARAEMVSLKMFALKAATASRNT
jgi:hypothetical protein